MKLAELEAETFIHEAEKDPKNKVKSLNLNEVQRLIYNSYNVPKMS